MTAYPYPKKQLNDLFLVSTKAKTPVLFRLRSTPKIGFDLKLVFGKWSDPQKAPKGKKEFAKNKRAEQVKLLKKITGNSEIKGRGLYDIIIDSFYASKGFSSADKLASYLGTIDEIAHSQGKKAWRRSEEFWINLFRPASYSPVGTENNERDAQNLVGATASIVIPKDLFLPVKPGLTIGPDNGLVGTEGDYLQVVDTRAIPETGVNKKGEEVEVVGDYLVGVVTWHGFPSGEVTEGKRGYEIFSVEDLPLSHNMWMFLRKGNVGSAASDTNYTVLHSQQEKLLLEQTYPESSYVRVSEDHIPETLLGTVLNGKKRGTALTLRESFSPRRKKPTASSGVPCFVVGAPEIRVAPPNLGNREYVVNLQVRDDPHKKILRVSSFELFKEKIKIDAKAKKGLLKRAKEQIRQASEGKLFEATAPTLQTAGESHHYISLYGPNPFHWYRESIRNWVPENLADLIQEADKEASARGMNQGVYSLWVRPTNKPQELPEGQMSVWSKLSEDQNISMSVEKFEDIIPGSASEIQKKHMAWLTDQLQTEGYTASADAWYITLVMKSPFEIIVVKDYNYIEEQLKDLRDLISPGFDEDGHLVEIPNEQDIHDYNIFLAKRYFEEM